MMRKVNGVREKKRVRDRQGIAIAAPGALDRLYVCHSALRGMQRCLGVSGHRTKR